MKLYEKASQDIEKLRKKENNKRRNNLMVYGWTIGYIIITFFSLRLMTNISNERLNSLFLGPVKVVLTILIPILILLIFIIVTVSLPTIRTQLFINQLNRIIYEYDNSDSKDFESLYNNLLNIKLKAKTIYELSAYYLNLSTILAYKGEIEEANNILNLLEKNSDSSKMRDYIKKQKNEIKDDLKIRLLIVFEEMKKLKKD